MGHHVGVVMNRLEEDYRAARTELRDRVEGELVLEDGWRVIADQRSALSVMRPDGVVWEFCAYLTLAPRFDSLVSGVVSPVLHAAWNDCVEHSDRREPLLITWFDGVPWLWSRVNIDADITVELTKPLAHSIQGVMLTRDTLEQLAWS